MEMSSRKIRIVGCGPGSPDYLTTLARRAVESAEVLVGAQRLLDLFPDVTAERVPLKTGLSEILDRIEELSSNRSVTVVVTGDPGLFSLSRLVIKRFGTGRVEVVCGISSVQVAFARIGLDWSDARIISTHADDAGIESEDIQNYDKLAVLCGRIESFSSIRSLLRKLPEDRRVFVCENLTLANETVKEVQPDQLEEGVYSPLTIVLVIKRELLS
jgi:cobalt-precorrin-7 (C5)-methyltransferase